MHISELDFDLPAELIASEPLAGRDQSRLLRIERSRSEYRDSSFAELPELLLPHDVLVLNNTNVFPARLLGESDTGASVEIFLVQQPAAELRAELAGDVEVDTKSELPVAELLVGGLGRVRVVRIDWIVPGNGKVLFRSRCKDRVHVLFFVGVEVR